MNDNSSSDHQPAQHASPTPAALHVPPVLHFDSIAQGAKEVLISHNEQIYRLRVTKNGKLILNK